MKLYAIRKNNMYIYLRYIDGDWDIPSPGDYYGAIRVEQVYSQWVSENSGTAYLDQYWNSNITLDNLATSRDKAVIFAAKYGGEVVTHQLTEVKE